MALKLINVAPNGERIGKGFWVNLDSDLSADLSRPWKVGDKIANNGAMFSEGWTFEVLKVRQET